MAPGSRCPVDEKKKKKITDALFITTVSNPSLLPLQVLALFTKSRYQLSWGAPQPSIASVRISLLAPKAPTHPHALSPGSLSPVTSPLSSRSADSYLVWIINMKSPPNRRRSGVAGRGDWVIQKKLCQRGRAREPETRQQVWESDS